MKQREAVEQRCITFDVESDFQPRWRTRCLKMFPAYVTPLAVSSTFKRCSTNGRVTTHKSPHCSLNTSYPDPELEANLATVVDQFARTGYTISYSMDVTNTGNTCLTNVEVTDALGSSVECPSSSTAGTHFWSRC